MIKYCDHNQPGDGMSLFYLTGYSPSLRKVRVEIQSRDHGRTLLAGLLFSFIDPRMACPHWLGVFLHQSWKCPHKHARTLTGPADGDDASTEAPSSYVCQDDNQDPPPDRSALPFLAPFLSLLCSPRQLALMCINCWHTQGSQMREACDTYHILFNDFFFLDWVSNLDTVYIDG